MPSTTSTQPGQLEVFIERTEHVAAPAETKAGGPAQKRMPFTTALSTELDGEKELTMVDHALRRLDEVEKEMGRDLVLNQSWASSEAVSSSDVIKMQAADSFMGKRSRYDDVFKNKVDWRPHLFGGIFKESNLVVPLARRITRQMVARAQNYFFETDPWFAAEPEGVEDTKLAEKIDRFAKYKLAQLGSKKNKERAIRRAFVQGEAVVKTTHVVRDQLFKTFANILIDAEGTPILDANAGFILETDKWQDETAVDVTTGQPVPTGTGKKVLARDGVTEKPATLLWREELIPKRQVMFQGPASPVVYYKDFLCPLTAADVQVADICAHLYDKPIMELVDLYVKGGMFDAPDKDRLEAVKRTVEMIRQLTSNTAEPKSGANQNDRPGDDQNRGSEAASTSGEPVAAMAEIYMWYDANGDGIMENIMLVVDRKNRVPVFYDYVPNVTIDGLRPFEVVRVNEVDGRWYGEGVMEMFESTQNIIDLLVNRWNKSQSAAGRVDFWRPDLTVEGRANPNLVMNYGNSYTLVAGAKVEEAMKSVYLEDIKFDNLERMFQFFMQVAQNESGTANGNDAETAGLETSKLATGIRNIEKSGQEMFAPFISDLEPSLQAILKRELLVLFANLDRVEVFQYLNRDTTTGVEIQKLDQITPDEVRNLTMNVSLLLTRYKGEQQLVQGEQASAIVERFYTLPVQIQPFVAQFYKNQLKAIDPRIDTEILIQPGIAQIAPTAAGSGPPASTTGAAGPTNPGQSRPNL